MTETTGEHRKGQGPAAATAERQKPKSARQLFDEGLARGPKGDAATDEAAGADDDQVKVNAAGLALGLKALLTEDDHVALETPVPYVVKGAGGNADMDRTFQIYPRPVHILALMADVYVKLIVAAGGFADAKDTGLRAVVRQIMLLRREGYELLLTLIQLMLVRPTGKPITLDDLTPPLMHRLRRATRRLLSRRPASDDAVPDRDYLACNLTLDDIYRLFAIFERQNNWREILGKVLASEALATRTERMRGPAAASRGRSSPSSGTPAGRTTTSAGESASQASARTSPPASAKGTETGRDGTEADAPVVDEL